MPADEDVEVGKIVNHTSRLDIGEIRQIVVEWVKGQGDAPTVRVVEPVHVAPAEDHRLLTKAARAWRQASGDQVEFQESISGTLFWFGLRYQTREQPGGASDEELPSQWPPEEEASEADAAGEPVTIGDEVQDADPRDGFGEIREE